MNRLSQSDDGANGEAFSGPPAASGEAGAVLLPRLAQTLTDLNLPEIDTYRPRIIALGQTKWTDLFEWLARDLTLRVDPQSFGDVRDGSMSWVIRAIQPEFGHREVAIKVCKYSVNTPQGALFRDEIATTAKLKHPGIPDILGHGVLPGGSLPYYVMHFLVGQTVAEILEARQTEQQKEGGKVKPTNWRSGDERVLLQIARDAASAIEYAHSEKIIHRDVKPSNILVAQNTGATFVIDFGLQSTPGNSDPSSGIVAYPRAGSPAYMAPEQCRGLPQFISPATDVWGLGMTLLEVLTSKPPPPFEEGASPSAVLRDPSCKVPEELAAIVRRCLQEDPKDRYLSAQRLSDDIERFLMRRPVDAFLREKTWVSDRGLYRSDLLTKRIFIDTARFASRHKLGTVILSFSTIGLSYGLYEYRNELAAEGKREAAAIVLDTRRAELARAADDQLKRARDFAERGYLEESYRTVTDDLLRDLTANGDDPGLAELQKELMNHKQSFGKLLQLQNEVYGSYAKLGESVEYYNPKLITVCVPGLEGAIEPYFPSAKVTDQGLIDLKAWLAECALSEQLKVRFGDRLLEALCIVEFDRHREVYGGNAYPREAGGKIGTKDFTERLRRIQAVASLTAEVKYKERPSWAVGVLRCGLAAAMGDPALLLAIEEEVADKTHRVSGPFMQSIIDREVIVASRLGTPLFRGAGIRDISGLQYTLVSDPGHLGAMLCKVEKLLGELLSEEKNLNKLPVKRLLVEACRALTLAQPENHYFQIRSAASVWALWQEERLLDILERSLIDGRPTVIAECTRSIVLCRRKGVPVPAELLFARGESYASLLEHDQAIQDLQECLQIDPKFISAKIELAGALLMSGRSVGANVGVTEEEILRIINEETLAPNIGFTAVGCLAGLAKQYPEKADDFLQRGTNLLVKLILKMPWYRGLARDLSAPTGILHPMAEYQPFIELVKEPSKKSN